MFLTINKTILKYLIYTIVIMVILSYLPSNKLSFYEYLFITLPIIGIYIMFDLLSSNISKKISKEKFEDSKYNVVPVESSPKKRYILNEESNDNNIKKLIKNNLILFVKKNYPKLNEKDSIKKMIEISKNKNIMKNIYSIVLNSIKNKNENFTESPKLEKNLDKSINNTIKNNNDNQPISTNTLNVAIKNAVKEAVNEIMTKTKSKSRSSKKIDPESDQGYNKFNKKNMKPLGEGLQSWKNDYVILNTDKWAPAQNPPPVCKVEKKCPVCPNMSAGYAKHYTTLKDFNPSRKVLNPDTINLDYLDKLNRGEA